jgi:hypothetical protein
MLDGKRLKQALRMCLVDEKGKFDNLAREAFGSNQLLARPWVLCQWLAALKEVHPWHGFTALPDFQLLRKKTDGRIRAAAFARDSSLAELESHNSMSRPEAGWRAMPRRPCLLLSGLSPWHGPCWLAWHDQDLHDSSSDPLAFMWDHACSPEVPSALLETGALCAEHLA